MQHNMQAKQWASSRKGESERRKQQPASPAGQNGLWADGATHASPTVHDSSKGFEGHDMQGECLPESIYLLSPATRSVIYPGSMI